MKKWIAAFLVFAPLSAAQCAATAWQSNEHGKVRLIADVQTAAAGGPLLLGLQFKTIPGWHVYWKNAGDAGYPPKADWAGSQGATAFEWLWPMPHRYELAGNVTAIGYEGDVVYPVRARATGKSVHIQSQISYLTCGEACVPYKYAFTLDIPVESAA